MEWILILIICLCNKNDTADVQISSHFKAKGKNSELTVFTEFFYSV